MPGLKGSVALQTTSTGLHTLYVWRYVYYLFFNSLHCNCMCLVILCWHYINFSSLHVSPAIVSVRTKTFPKLKQNEWSFMTSTANELPGVQTVHFMFAGEFFAYHWSPNRLVLMKPLKCRIKFIVGRSLIQDLRQTFLAPEFCHMYVVRNKTPLNLLLIKIFN